MTAYVPYLHAPLSYAAVSPKCRATTGPRQRPRAACSGVQRQSARWGGVGGSRDVGAVLLLLFDALPAATPHPLRNLWWPGSTGARSRPNSEWALRAPSVLWIFCLLKYGHIM